VINSRRFIASPEAQDKASYQVEFAVSALGHKQTLAPQKAMSALAPIATAKAASRKIHVCFTPESRHLQCTRSRWLWAKKRTGNKPIELGALIVSEKDRRLAYDGAPLRPLSVPEGF
jgi:hypothetical protein